MHTAVPCDTVVTLDTGHSPQYAAPAALAAGLGALRGTAVPPDVTPVVQLPTTDHQEGK